MSDARPPKPRLRALAQGALAAILLAGLLPATAVAVPAGAPAADGAALTGDPVEPFESVVEEPVVTGPLTDAGSEGAPGQEPSAAYADAMAHAGDRIEFTPGERVTVGYKPRSGDTWQVGGTAPVALPAGRVTGRDMAKTLNGTVWTPKGGSAPVTDPKPGATGLDTGGTTAPDAPIDAPANRPVTSARGVVATQPAGTGGFDLAAASGLRRQVYGFLPYWETNGASTKLNFDVLSTVAYFSVGANAKGNLKKRDADGTLTTGWGGWTSSSMTKVINEAHRNGTRVVLTLSVFAWTGSQASVQKSILGSKANRLNFVRQAVAAVRDRGADGVNLDFEPLARGYEDEFVSLLKTFRSEFNKIHAGYSVVYDTTAFIGNYPLERSVGKTAADAIFVMGYDYRIGSAGKSGSIAPLSGPSYDLADTVRAYTRRVPASRVILGLPWYGRAWSTATDKPRSETLTGLKYGYSRPVNYENVQDFVAKYGRRWDPIEQSPYVAYRRENCTSTYGCVSSWRQIWYDDAASLTRRYALVNDYNLRGTGMWALGYDGGHAELYKALASSFLVDKTAPVVGIRTLASGQVDEGFVVSWVGKDTSPIVSYDVQVSVNGGGWRTWLAKTTRTSAVFLGASGRGYAFRVRATDSKGHVSSYNVAQTYDATPSLATGGFARVTKDGLSYRAGPGTSSGRLGSLPAGTLVALTRGPVSRDGYTWFEVTTPVKQWTTVSFVERGVWIAVAKGSTRYVRAAAAPNTTRIAAVIRGLDFGAAGAPRAVGTSVAQQAARAFSPNGDRTKDGLRLRWTNTKRLSSLKVVVRRLDGTAIGSRLLPDLGAGAQDWTWDGKVNGTRLKDGQYLLQLVGSAGGRTVTAPSARPATPEQIAAYAVRIDTVRPLITAASATNQVISPNGDGIKDSTKVSLTASGGVVRWVATVRTAAGAIVRSKTGTGATGSLTWKGTTDAGARVPDGVYTIGIALYDAAGNAATRTGRVTVDTKGPVGSPAASAPVFAPNGDGLLDTTTLAWRANEPATGTARLYRGSTLVRSWKISGAATWSKDWDGRRADGSRVPDGTYTLRVDVRDAVGNRRVTSTTVVVDRTLKGLAWGAGFFPQDGDALASTSKLTFALTRDAKTRLTIRDAAGRIVRTAWSGKAQAAGTRGFTWDGRRDDGTFAPQGRYTATLRVRSAYGVVEVSRDVWAAAFTITPNRTTVRAGQTLTVRFRSTEPLSTTPRVTWKQPGRTGVTVTATKLSDGSFKASFTVRSGSAGTGSVTVSAKDRNGVANTSKSTLRVAG